MAPRCAVFRGAPASRLRSPWRLAPAVPDARVLDVLGCGGPLREGGSQGGAFSRPDRARADARPGFNGRMTTAAAYTELVARLKRAHVLGTVNGMLAWDEQVNLPPDSADLRAEQLAVMAELHHAAASDRRIGELLSQ